MQKSKDTDKEFKIERLKVYSVDVEMTDFIIGRDKDEAIEAYKAWIFSQPHIAKWTLKNVQYRGKAW